MNTDSLSGKQRVERKSPPGPGLIGKDEEAVAICADHAGVVGHGLAVFVLVSVEEEFGFMVGEVGVECGEAGVNLVVTVMDGARGVVRDEDIDRRKAFEHLLHFVVLEKVVPLGLVFPRTAKAPEFNAAEHEGRQVEIPDRRRKRRTGVMVAFDRQYLATTALGTHGKNGLVGQIATRDQEVWVGFGHVPANGFVVSDDEQGHRMTTVSRFKRKGES